MFIKSSSSAFWPQAWSQPLLQGSLSPFNGQILSGSSSNQSIYRVAICHVLLCWSNTEWLCLLSLNVEWHLGTRDWTWDVFNATGVSLFLGPLSGCIWKTEVCIQWYIYIYIWVHAHTHTHTTPYPFLNVTLCINAIRTLGCLSCCASSLQSSEQSKSKVLRQRNFQSRCRHRQIHFASSHNQMNDNNKFKNKKTTRTARKFNCMEVWQPRS